MTVDLLTTFATITCASVSCGFTFAVPDHWWQKMHDRHQTIYCPKCKSGTYWPSESDEEALRRQLNSTQDMLATSRRESTRLDHQRRAEKAAKTRLKNRIAAGVCPCCNRTFANLARHMTGQHPDFKKKPKTKGKKK